MPSGKDIVPYRMSQRLRLELERIAGLCNDYNPHEAGDRLEQILGYRVDTEGNRIESEDNHAAAS